MTERNPFWTAPRSGHDWICEDTKRGVEWLTSFVPENEINHRLNKCRESYLRRRAEWEDGLDVQLFDPKDQIAWYIFQARTYSEGREFWTPDEAAKIVPYIQKIGRDLDHVEAVAGVEKRVKRLMTTEKSQPEGGIYELLVASSYKRHGWSKVEFVDETPGCGKTPDLHVVKPGSRWAAECKRILRSSYAVEEEKFGKLMAAKVHALSEAKGDAFVLDVRFHEELKEYSENYLVERIRPLLPIKGVVEDCAERADIRLRPVEWGLVRYVMASDYVYVGSTRMMELLSGEHEHAASHSMSVRCRRAIDKPSFADTIYHASLVNWVTTSVEALRKKATHFRKKIAAAESQLPGDRPGVVHIGMESLGQKGVDQWRHYNNYLTAKDFYTSSSRLRWIYGNYFQVEVTTRENESCAMEETMVPYRIGSHGTNSPLPGHLLVADDDSSNYGPHW